jgi:hypothetical protein
MLVTRLTIYVERDISAYEFKKSLDTSCDEGVGVFLQWQGWLASLQNTVSFVYANLSKKEPSLEKKAVHCSENRLELSFLYIFGLKN